MQVQNGWLALEPVFGSGDIAKKMPLMAKKFQGIDKRWVSIMEKASDTKKVIACCSMDMLKSFLPELEEHLEDCKRSLDEFLEMKRLLFSRFFFVSEQVLLIILSQGSDPRAVVEFFGGKLFDAIGSVEFQKVKSKKGSSKILQIVTISQDLGGHKETVRLVKPVKCENEIELWLKQLEKSMMKTIREKCRKCSEETKTLNRFEGATGGGDIKAWIEAQESQIALLGIQILWTRGIHEALTRTTGKQEKPNLDPERESAEYILKHYLRFMCLEASGTKIRRVKVETLVTIQVHQLDLFSDLPGQPGLGKVTNVGDFNW
jgi:dynein heavy chain